MTTLNKSLKDLRKKELFAWQPDQVSTVDVKWRSGEEFSLDRQGEAKEWKSANQPDVRIRARKVGNLLDELHWLRAVDFEEKTEKDAMPSGALVDVKLTLKDGQTSELKVADPDQAKKQAVAASSEIEGPVRISTHILSAIPKSADSLADRSLISADAADIREITWKTESGSGNLVWMDQNKLGDKGRQCRSQGYRKSEAAQGLPVRDGKCRIHRGGGTCFQSARSGAQPG